MKKWFFALLLCISFLPSQAQNYEADALLLSTDKLLGSARFMSVGGAFSSVGADATNGSYNPAGLGMYRRNEIILSPGLVFNRTRSSYLDNSESQTGLRVSLNNISAVFNSPRMRGKNPDIRHANIAFGVNRTASFYKRETIQAENPFHSYADSWRNEIELATNNTNQGFDYENYDGSVSIDAVNAYQTYLVNWDDSTSMWTDPVSGTVDQEIRSTTRGGKSDIFLGAGWNYLDKVYVGASIGLPIVRYERELRVSEEEIQAGNQPIDSLYDFSRFDYQQNYETQGLGVNARLGVLYQPKPGIRFALALHTPTRMGLSETYTSQIETLVFVPGLSDQWEFSPPGPVEFDYTLRTPWKAITGASFVINQKGFISLDYEMTDMNSIRYDFGDDFEDQSDVLNERMKETYRAMHAIKLGGEVVFGKFRLRAGAGFTSSPFEKGQGVDGSDFSSLHASAGWGIRGNRFFFDMGFQHQQVNQFQLLYTQESGLPPAGVSQTRGHNHLVFTVGLLR